MKKLAILAALMALATGCEAGECKCGDVVVGASRLPDEPFIFQTTKLTNWVTQLKPREQNWVQFGEVVGVKSVSVWVDARWLTTPYETNKLSDICRSYRVRPPKEPEYDFWGERVPTSQDKEFFRDPVDNLLNYSTYTTNVIWRSDY